MHGFFLSVGLRDLLTSELPPLPESFVLRPSFPPESCLILNKSRGPITPMPRGSHSICTMQRRPISQEFLLVRSFMVCTRHPHLHACLAVLNLFVWSILGILVVVFFQCVVSLVNPINPRRDGIKWGLVTYTVATFLFVTVLTGMGLHIGSISMIDNREFPGVEGVLPPGPLGYQDFIRSTAFTIIPNFMFFLNNWLADGFLVSFIPDPVSVAQVS